LRDRALKVADVFTQNRRLWVRLREKGGKAHTMPCHHDLETYIVAYIGDMRAVELILSRAWPARKGRPVSLALPPILTGADLPGACPWKASTKATRLSATR